MNKDKEPCEQCGHDWDAHYTQDGGQTEHCEQCDCKGE